MPRSDRSWASVLVRRYGRVRLWIAEAHLLRDRLPLRHRRPRIGQAVRDPPARVPPLEEMGERRPRGLVQSRGSAGERGAAARRWRRWVDGGASDHHRVGHADPDGETEVHVLTNLPAEVADALAVADLYRRRWTVEAAFGELATCLDGEIDTLGYLKAALFAFRVALVSYNVMSVGRRRRVRSTGEEAVEGLSFYYLADEVAGTPGG